MNLYHYASNAAFYSIVSSATVRLNLLSLSNDSSEGLYIAEVLEECVLQEAPSPERATAIMSDIQILLKLLQGFGFCLSREGDLLSQWRGYADDGQGVSIGFDSSIFEKEATNLTDGIRLFEVAYDADQQLELLRPIAKKFVQSLNDRFDEHKAFLNKKLSNDDPISADEFEVRGLSPELFLEFSKLPYIYSFKDQAFSEEQEFRATLVSTDKNIAPDDCLFNPRLNCLAPFYELDLFSDSKHPIVEVILGPKNRTPPYVVEKFLATYQYSNVKVTRSSASYYC